MKNLSTRVRIIILVVLAALPTLAVTMYGSWDERARAVTGARKDMQTLAKLAAQQQEHIIQGAKQTLVAISLIPTEVRNDRVKCNEFLARLQAKSAGLYHSMGIFRSDGVLQCNAVPWQGRISSGDRLFFKLAQRTGMFAVGEYQVGRVTQRAGINLGYPVTDLHGIATGVAFVSLDLGRLEEMAADVPLPEQGILEVLDRNGILLARYPPLAGIVGNKLPIPDILNTVLARRDGELVAKGIDGVERLIAFHTVAVNPDGGVPIRVVVSVPMSVILADANRAMMRDIGGILVAALLLLVGAWYGAEVFVLRSIRTLLSVTKHVHAGQLGARTGLVDGKDELAQLGSAFDDMASALQAREADLQRALHDMERQAITDPLTGLYNRRFSYDALPRELALARRNNQPLTVMMIDIDHFKQVNDTYGHETGDRVLKAMAQLIKTAVRGSDYSCRYGGEEFLLVLPDAPLEGARVRAEAIRSGAQAMEISCAEGKRVTIAVSIGIAAFPEHGGDADSLLRAADEALYEAKRAGRNRVIMCGMRDAARPAAALN